MALAPSVNISFPGNLPSVPTIAALRLVSPLPLKNGDNWVVDGDNAGGDGGGGVYVWNETSVTADDGFRVVKPNVLTFGQAGRWILQGIANTLQMDGDGNLVALSQGGVTRDVPTTAALASGTLPIGVAGTRPFWSIAETTLYCDPIDGNDANPGTQAMPMKTINGAMQRVPVKLYHRYTIDLRTVPASKGQLPAIYNEDALLDDVEGLGNRTSPTKATNFLQIMGAGPTPVVNPSTDIQIGSITMTGCKGTATPYIYGAHLLRCSPYYEADGFLTIFACDEAGGQNLTFANTSVPSAANVRVYASRAIIKQSTAGGNAANFVWAKRNSEVSVSDCDGLVTGAALRVEENSTIQPIRVKTNEGLGGQRFMVFGGGQIIDQSGNILRSSGSTGGIYYGWPAGGGGSLSPAEGAGGYSVGIGFDFKALVAESVVIGHSSEALGPNGVAVGSGAKAGGDAAHTNSVAIGSTALANGARRATALGAFSSALFENSVAIGYNAVATAANVVQLGSNNAANCSLGYRVAGTQVVGAQGATVANAVPAAGSPSQAEFNALVTQFNALLARVRTHGLIAP